MLSRLFIAALWPPAGKGLTLWSSFVMFKSVLSLSGILGQAGNLIVSIPDLCHLSYIKSEEAEICLFFEYCATYRATSIPPTEVWMILGTSKQNKVSPIPHYLSN